MALGLYSLIEAVILCLNAVCVLHEERFLAKSNLIIKILMIAISVLYLVSVRLVEAENLD